MTLTLARPLRTLRIVLLSSWCVNSLEDRLNLRSLTSFEKRTEAGEEVFVPTNAGAAFKYIFENCVVEAKNVLLEDGEFESLKGDKKNELFC